MFCYPYGSGWMTAARPKRKTWMGQDSDTTVKRNVKSSKTKKKWRDFHRWHEHLTQLTTGKSPDIPRMETIVYDRNGKPLRIIEVTAPRDFALDFESRELQGKFRPNPRKEHLGKIDFARNIALKAVCYHEKPLNEIPRFQKSVTGGTLVVSGGAHEIKLGLSFRKAVELRRMLDRLIYRLKRAPIHPRFAYVIRIDTTNETKKKRR